MPNLKEFFDRAEIIKKPDLESIHGTKPCSKCDLDAQEAFWDPNSMILAWECPNGHSNQVKVD